MKDVRKDFKILNNSDLIYFDSAATTQKPNSVIEAVVDYYENSNANPLRGIYDLGVDATEKYKNSRLKVQEFIDADSAEEIVFTRNATESINLVANSYGMNKVSKGDEIVISIMEHHSNILPWQAVCKKNGATLRYIYCDKEGNISLDEIHNKITDKTKIVAITQVSNVLGRENPIKEIIDYAHKMGAVVLVDGAQSVPHMPVSVKDLNVDFLAFSGHKMLAPMGIGVLYGKKELLNNMPPFLTGGEMIDCVTEQDAVFTDLPHKFEAGTVNCGGAVGLSAAIDYIQDIGFSEIVKKEKELTEILINGMVEIPEINIVGSKNPEDHLGIVSFNIEGVHPHDAATVLNEKHIAVRAGRHCAQPLLKHIGSDFCLRASLYFYNTEEEVHRFLDELKNVRGVMGYES